MDLPHYNPQLADAPLSDAELDGLDALLQALPAERAMNVEAMDGYLTALLLAPVDLPTLPGAAWLPAVWGGDGADGAPFASGRQRKKAGVLVLRHLHSIACRLRDAPQRWQPLFSIVEAEGREWVDAEDWCVGFLEGVALDPDGWTAVFDDAELAAALRPLVLLGGDDSALAPADARRLADPDERDALSRAVVEGVLALHARRVSS